MPFTGVVEPTAQAAVNATKNGVIGVIGTSATVGSKSYKKAILAKDKKFKVYQQECPLFVSLVENGFISEDDKIVQLVAERYLEKLKNIKIDTLILGCTHFQIIAKAIQNYLGDEVTLIDSGRETAIYAADMLKEKNLLNKSTEKGEAVYYVSDTVEDFRKTAQIFLGQNDIQDVYHITL